MSQCPHSLLVSVPQEKHITTVINLLKLHGKIFPKCNTNNLMNNSDATQLSTGQELILTEGFKAQQPPK